MDTSDWGKAALLCFLVYVAAAMTLPADPAGMILKIALFAVLVLTLAAWVRSWWRTGRKRRDAA